MMTFSPIDDQSYDVAATQIAYCKMFPHMVEDFITREDAKEMMKMSNLPVTTEVQVNPGQAVSVVVPAGTGSTTSPGKGKGDGNVKANYDGGVKIAADEALIKEKQAIKDAGGTATTKVIDVAMGG
jgi:hypothetical protein